MDNSSFAVVPFLQDHLLVFIALALCAVLALLVVVGMVWGAKLKRQRVHAEHEEEARIDALETQDDSGRLTEAQEAAGIGGASDAPNRANDDRADIAPEENVAPRPGSPPIAVPAAHAVDESASPDPLDDEPVAAAAPLDASPATEVEPIPAEPTVTSDTSEPVTRLKGLGPKVAARLAELGVTNVTQIAALGDNEAAALDAQLGNFSGRMARDQWREQARLLAAGDRVGYEARYGKLG